MRNLLFAMPNALHFTLGGLLLCLRVITVNPALVTSANPGQKVCIVDDLLKLLADVDTLLLLISRQKSQQARYTTPNKREKNQHMHPSA
jgi:hypothetical protein